MVWTLSKRVALMTCRKLNKGKTSIMKSLLQKEIGLTNMTSSSMTFQEREERLRKISKMPG